MSSIQEKPKGVVSIPLEKLEFWEEANVRKKDVFLNIDDLAKNIATVGIQVPPLVKEEQPEKRYLVFSGQRRV